MDRLADKITITSGPFYRSEKEGSWVNISKSFNKEYSHLGNLLDDIIDEVRFSRHNLSFRTERKLTDEIGIYVDDESARSVYLEIGVKETLKDKELKNYVVNVIDEYISLFKDADEDDDDETPQYWDNDVDEEDFVESRHPRGRMLKEGIIYDSDLTTEQTEQAYEAFKGYVKQIVQAAEHGLPGEEWEINVGQSGNPFCRSVWAVKNFDEKTRHWDDFVSLFQISLDEEYKDFHNRFEDGYFRLKNTLKDPDDHGYLATVSDDKIWFSDFYEDRGREPGFFASASELDRVEHIVKVSLKNR